VKQPHAPGRYDEESTTLPKIKVVQQKTPIKVKYKSLKDDAIVQIKAGQGSNTSSVYGGESVETNVLMGVGSAYKLTQQSR